MMYKDVNISLNEKDVTTCFALSKMTNYNEFMNRDKYLRMDFPEFFEFLGRIADTVQWDT